MIRHPYYIAFWLLIAAMGLQWIPGDVQVSIRTTFGDLMKPGCLVWRSLETKTIPVISQFRATTYDETATIANLKNQLNAATEKNHRLEIRLAHQQEAAARNHPLMFSATNESARERLAKPQLIEAAVLNQNHTSLWRKGRWLDQGKSGGLLEEALVLSGSGPVIDMGRDAGLSAEDPLLLGRSLVGRVQHVGRWTSTFLPITDSAFRCRAQLVRMANDEPAFGAKGILKGNGDSGCLLEGIPASETVDVGDAIYTADRDGLLPTPFYCGVVAEATIEDNANEWRILVIPMNITDLTKLQVLKMELNTQRVYAN